MVGVRVAGCAIGVAAVVWPIPGMLEVASYPPGTSMRPMGETFMIFLGQAAGVLLVLPMAVVSLSVGWRVRRGWVLALITALVATAAILVDYQIFNHIIATNGYVMEP